MPVLWFSPSDSLHAGAPASQQQDGGFLCVSILKTGVFSKSPRILLIKEEERGGHGQEELVIREDVLQDLLLYPSVLKNGSRRSPKPFDTKHYNPALTNNKCQGHLLLCQTTHGHRKKLCICDVCVCACVVNCLPAFQLQSRRRSIPEREKRENISLI